MFDGIRGLLFDLDGTLVDSMWMWKQIDIDFLESCGLRMPEDLQRKIEGMSFSETAVYFKERFRLKQSLDEIKSIWTQMSIDKYRREVPFKPGAEEFLRLASGKGMKTGIATSNGREIVEGLNESLRLDRYIQVLVTGCEVASGKPAPDIYLEAARRLGLSPEECLVFEDVPAGIAAGKAAGMRVCAVDDAASAPYRDEVRMLADYYVRDFRDILPEFSSNEHCKERINCEKDRKG